MKICTICRQTKRNGLFDTDSNKEFNLYCIKCDKFKLDMYVPNYNKHVKELKLDSINSHYPEALTIADWENMTQKQKQSYDKII